MLCNGRTDSVERNCRWNTGTIDLREIACLGDRRRWSMKAEGVTGIIIEKEDC